MKHILIFILATCSLGSVSAQEANLYDQALKQACSSLESFFAKDELYIEEGLLTTKNLKQSSCTKQLYIIGPSEIRKKAKKRSKNKPFRFVRIVPLRLEDGKFYVTVIVFEAKAKGSNLRLTNLYGENLYLRYDCYNQSFDFTPK